MERKEESIRKAKASLIFSMLVFGTIGIFVRYIPLSSSMIALVRGVIGTIFLLIVLCRKGPGIAWKDIKRNLFYLCLSGACTLLSNGRIRTLYIPCNKRICRIKRRSHKKLRRQL